MLVVSVRIPETTPDADMVATILLPEVHVPPAVVLFKVVVLPVHTIGNPVIFAGSGFTFIVNETAQPVRSIL